MPGSPKKRVRGSILGPTSPGKKSGVGSVTWMYGVRRIS